MILPLIRTELNEEEEKALIRTELDKELSLNEPLDKKNRSDFIFLKVRLTIK